MTGTASKFYEHNDFISNKLSSTELFSAWLFGKIKADCLLSSISLNGCSILIPKNYPLLKQTFNLVIMSPCNKEIVHTVLSAKQCWSNEHHSHSHAIVGIQFTNIKEDLYEEIEALISYLSLSKNNTIKCSTINR